MIDWAKYANVKYDDMHYNCLHFAADIYRDLTGYDMGLFVDDLMTGEALRKINPYKLKKFIRIDTPQSPCLAVMRGQSTHAGIFYNNTILHLIDNGMQSVPPHIAEIQHGNLSYYTIAHT